MDWLSFQKTVKTLFARFPGLDFQFSSDKIVFPIEDAIGTYSIEEFDTTSAKLSKYTVSSTAIYSSNEIEVFIEPFEPRYGYRFREEEFGLSDASVTYTITRPSDELILAFLSSISSDSLRNYSRMLSLSTFSNRYLRSDNDEIRLFDMILKVIRVALSLKIKTTESTSSTDLFKYANSLLFTLAYNTDGVYKIVHSLADVESGKGRPMPRRHLRVSEIESPKLFFISELTEQYSLALSSGDPFVKYIAYYHIMEYFFEEIYSGALIKSVREVLLHPGFSTKSPKEINKVINLVRQKTRATKDEFQGTELEALELTIKSFVSLEQLRDDLSSYNSGLLEYYKSHEITFSNGDCIDLNDFKNERLPKKIAARIYKTRNSLVHHKSNSTREKERGIYHPFKNDKELSQEMPLMRLIAEAIIIKSAEEI